MVMINPITEEEFSRIKELRKTKSTAEVAGMLNRSGASILRANSAVDWVDYLAKKKIWADYARGLTKSKSSNPDPRVQTFKTLQAKVLATFMSPEEYDALIKKYNENRRGMGVELREKSLKVPLTSSEKTALLQYINLANSQAIKDTLSAGSNFAVEVNRIATKFLYQNKELLNLDELLGGGENS